MGKSDRLLANNAYMGANLYLEADEFAHLKQRLMSQWLLRKTVAFRHPNSGFQQSRGWHMYRMIVPTWRRNSILDSAGTSI